MDHAFNTLVAEQYGVGIAILLQNFKFWTITNIANNKNIKNGKFWSYDTFVALHIKMPYYSIDQLKRLVSKSIELDLVEKGNFNKIGFDRTCWYCLTELGCSFYPEIAAAKERFTRTESIQNEPEQMSENQSKPAPLSSVRNRTIECADPTNRLSDIAPPIPDTNPDIKTNTKETTTTNQISISNEIQTSTSSSSSFVFSKDIDLSLIRLRKESPSDKAVSDHEFLEWCHHWVTNICKAPDESGKMLALKTIIKKYGLSKPAGFGVVKMDTPTQAIDDEKIRYRDYRGSFIGYSRFGMLKEGAKPMDFEQWIDNGMPETFDASSLAS